MVNMFVKTIISTSMNMKLSLLLLLVISQFTFSKSIDININDSIDKNDDVYVEEVQTAGRLPIFDIQYTNS